LDAEILEIIENYFEDLELLEQLISRWQGILKPYILAWNTLSNTFNKTLLEANNSPEPYCLNELNWSLARISESEAEILKMER